MPRYKLSDKDRKKISYIKRECPCITKALLAYIFDISPSRVGEVIREDAPKREAYKKFTETLETIE